MQRAQEDGDSKRQDRDAGGRFGKDVHVIVLSWRLSSVHAREP